MFEQDYIMRIVHNLVRFLAKVLLGKDVVSYELSEEESSTTVDCLHKQLLALIAQGRINEAENLLYKELDPGDKKYIELSLDFYERLNNMDDAFLEKSDFSREEIEQGLKEIARKFGIPLE